MRATNTLRKWPVVEWGIEFSKETHPFKEGAELAGENYYPLKGLYIYENPNPSPIAKMRGYETGPQLIFVSESEQFGKFQFGLSARVSKPIVDTAVTKILTNPDEIAAIKAGLRYFQVIEKQPKQEGMQPFYVAEMFEED